MLPILILALCALTSNLVYASPYSEEAMQLLHHAETRKHEYLNEAKSLKEQSKGILEQALNISTNKEQQQALTNKEIIVNKDTVNNVLIFVSFSIPKETLKNLAKQAKDNNAILIMRGLKNSSFKETAKYLQDLEIGLQIDPLLFKQYNIRSVPTFVLQNGEDFHSLTGNVSLIYAMQKLREANQ